MPTTTVTVDNIPVNLSPAAQRAFSRDRHPRKLDELLASIDAFTDAYPLHTIDRATDSCIRVMRDKGYEGEDQEAFYEETHKDLLRVENKAKKKKQELRMFFTSYHSMLTQQNARAEKGTHEDAVKAYSVIYALNLLIPLMEPRLRKLYELEQVANDHIVYLQGANR